MGSVPEISPATLAARLAAGERLVLLDVRRPDEHETARLDHSVLIPLHELTERLDELDPSEETVVYCHHGVRSLSGVVILARAGFARVVSLAGGIDAWSASIDPAVPRY
jgi:rhodanese-related sulfurtransferase